MMIWDLWLTDVNKYKQECLEDDTLDATARRRVLESRMPRFIWLARGRASDGEVTDLLFDATGLEASNLCFMAVDRSTSLGGALKDLSTAGQADFDGVPGIMAALLRGQ